MKNEMDPLTGTFPASNGGTENMFRALISKLPQKTLDEYQIICSRVREIDSNKKQILWLHDTADDPESFHLAAKHNHSKWHKMVFVSNYQFQTYHQKFGITYDRSVVIRNAIEPFNFPLTDGLIVKPDANKELRLIYHTTPHRGLELLAPAFDLLTKHHENLHLDVFSSFSIYGWQQRDEQYKEIFDFLKAHPNVTYHGAQPNSVVRSYLEKAHIFAYPSIWPETSCIAAIEAAAAGCIVLSSDYAALPETLLNKAIQYRFNEDKLGHLNTFVSTLDNLIKTYRSNQENTIRYASNQYHEFNDFYSWDRRILEWNRLLNVV